jgi:hypothetical protein
VFWTEDYNYGTAMNKLIDYYKEMLELIIQARLASDRIDEWKEVLSVVTNPDQTNTIITRKPNFYRDYL